MFDPLHKWLGIPPDQQPPNHYRLLGIDPFESDPDVIDVAADKQLTFLHQLTGDEHAEAAENLSNQVSIARLCLLDPEKKKVYDSALSRAQQPAAEPVVREPGPTFVPTRSPKSAPSKARTSTLRNQPRHRERTKSKSPWAMVSAIGGIVVLLMLFLGIQQGKLKLDWLTLSPSQSASDQEVTIKAATPGPLSRPSSGSTSTKAVLKNPRRTTSQPMVPPQNADETTKPAKETIQRAQETIQQEPQAQQTPSQAGNPEPETEPAPMPRRSLADLLHDTSPEPENTGPDQEGTGDSANERASGKSPLPNKVALADKMALVRDLYQDQYINAKSSRQRIELARQMHRDGELTTDDAVGRFALWQVSRDIFAAQGRFNAAMAIADNLSMFYDEVDAESLKLESLKESSAKIAASELHDFYDTSMQFAEICCDRNRHVVATDTIVFMLQAFGDRLDFTRVENAKRVRDQAAAEGQRYREFKQAISTLANSPDANASETVGKYLAFVRADWEEAIHYLAKSPDESLASAAQLQIEYQNNQATATNATDNEVPDKKVAALEVADAWYNASANIKDPEKRKQVLRHAVAFYVTAVETKEGLVKRKAEAQIAKINNSLGEASKSAPSDSVGPDADNTGGVVLGYRVYNSSSSKSDFAKRRRNRFIIGMGKRPGGIGEAAVGVELKSVELIEVTGSASHDSMTVVDAFSKTGFIIDYHSPGGYTNRVFLGLGISPGRKFTQSPTWGTGDKPETVVDIGKSAEYKIDLTRWAPPTWDGRSWITLFMQNAGEGRSIEAEIKW